MSVLLLNSLIDDINDNIILYIITSILYILFYDIILIYYLVIILFYDIMLQELIYSLFLWFNGLFYG